MFLSRFVTWVALGAVCLIPFSARAFDDDPAHRLVHKDLLLRIERGDYVWSSSFPVKDAALLGYGRGLMQGLDQLCPQALPSGAVHQSEAFFLSWMGNGFGSMTAGGNGLQTVASALLNAGITNAMSKDAKNDAITLMRTRGCGAKETKELSANLARMLSGRRPAYGDKASAPALVSEQSALITSKDTVGEGLEKIQTPGSIELEAEFKAAAGMGLTVLQCKYTDKDPMYYNVQYYWGANSPATLGFMVPSVASAFLRTNQARLQKANGSAIVTHPFLWYGSPRWECPAEIDPALPKKRIYAPRQVTSNANLPTTPAAPVVKDQGSYRVYDYGAVRDEFVPPMPAELPQGKFLVLSMNKQVPGSIVRISVLPFFWGALTRNDLDYRNRPQEQALLQADVNAARQEDAMVLKCEYLGQAVNTVSRSWFWFKTRPAAADPALLKSHIADHPMLEIHGPVATCPVSAQAAKRIGAGDPPTKSAVSDSASTDRPPMVIQNADGTITIQKEPPQGDTKDERGEKGLVIPPQVVIPINPTPKNGKPKMAPQHEN